MICLNLLRPEEEKAVNLAPEQRLRLLAGMANLEAARRSAKQKEYRKTHYQQIRANEVKSKLRHRAETLAKQKTPQARAKHNAYLKKYRLQNKERDREKLRLKNRAYHHTHREKRREQQLRSMARHPDSVLKGQREYRERNRERLRKYLNGYLPGWREKQRRENPQYLLKDRLRSTLKRGLAAQGLLKVARTEAMVGCSITELKAHIEAQFVNGMRWNVPDSFSIDHLVPIAAFNLLDAEELFWAFNWRNLRPLTLIENLQKSAKLPSPLPSWLPAYIAERILARR